MKINKNWLREHGVKGDDTTLTDVVAHAQAALELRVGYALAEELNDEERKAFENLLHENASDAVRVAWLKEHCPNYTQIVNEITADFQRDIINSEHPIMFILEQTI